MAMRERKIAFECPRCTSFKTTRWDDDPEMIYCLHCFCSSFIGQPALDYKGGWDTHRKNKGVDGKKKKPAWALAGITTAMNKGRPTHPKEKKDGND